MGEIPVAETVEQLSISHSNNDISIRTDINQDELLISEVQCRPQLYDYILPLRERSRQKTRELWREVAEQLGEQKTSNICSFCLYNTKEPIKLQ